MIVLPFPSPKLAGHHKTHWSAMRPIIREHREWARLATLAAKASVNGEGDIIVRVSLYPPHNRGDRLNYPTRLKPYFDGIADALGVNDKRFVPQFDFMAPEAPGRVEVRLG